MTGGFCYDHSLSFLSTRQMDEEEEDAALSQTTDKNALANLILEKLQELTEIFEQKNEEYMSMEERSENLHKVWLIDTMGCGFEGLGTYMRQVWLPMGVNIV